MPLDPQAQRVIEAMAALNLKPVESSTPDEARESIRTRTAALGPFEDVAAVADHRVPVAGGEITVRAYSPGGPGPHPALVYYHGGGWVIGDLYTHDGLCRSLTNAARCAVLSVDYRLAPESKYPVAGRGLVRRASLGGGQRRPARDRPSPDRRRRGQRGRQPGHGGRSDGARARRARPGPPGADLSRHRPRPEHAVLRGERNRLRAHARGHAVVLEPLSRPRGPGPGAACLAASERRAWPGFRPRS